LIKQYELTDHLCCKCGSGRILKVVDSLQFYCSTCQKEAAAISELCWCGTKFNRGGIMYDTKCATKEQTDEGWHTKFQDYKMLVLWKPSKRHNSSE
jgi:hypothetical protein